MSTIHKNFSGKTTPSIIDTTYIECNFTNFAPIGDTTKTGVRLFPGDDTSRTFIRCNLVNCETPPGSTLNKCNTTIRETRIYKDSDYVEIDGHSVEIENYVDKIYGRYLENGSYEYKDPVIEIENTTTSDDL